MVCMTVFSHQLNASPPHSQCSLLVHVGHSKVKYNGELRPGSWKAHAISQQFAGDHIVQYTQNSSYNQSTCGIID